MNSGVKRVESLALANKLDPNIGRRTSVVRALLSLSMQLVKKKKKIIIILEGVQSRLI